MASLNKVMLMGNLTRDAELRYLPSGQAVLEFRLAVSRRYRTQQGEDREETCFVDINLWGKRGEALAQYLTKGKPLFVEGRLQLDEWEKDGQKHSRLRVVAENVEFIGGSKTGETAPRAHDADPSYAAGNGNGGPRPNPAARQAVAASVRDAPYDAQAASPVGSSPGLQLPSDDIPF